MRKLLLVTFDDNWSDELNIYGFKVMYEESFNQMMALAQKIIENNPYREYYFGTNEAIEYSSFKEYESAITTNEITQEEADLLLRLFGDPGRALASFGHFIVVTEYDDVEDDEEDDDE